MISFLGQKGNIYAIKFIYLVFSFLNIRSIRYDTANPPNTLMAATPIEMQARTFVAVPFSADAMRIPPKITTPERLLLVLIRGLVPYETFAE